MSPLWTKLKHVNFKLFQVPVRYLNLMEYQSKHLLKQCGVSIQDFCMVDTSSSNELNTFRADEYVIKAQILAGGRGKGHFDNGFKGGVHITKNFSDIPNIVNKMLGHRLVTKQTPKEGIPVMKVMIARSVNILRETYISIIMDRQKNGPVIIASPAGGMDIETVAEKTPHLIKTIPVDIFEGVTDEKARDLAEFLEFKGPLREKAVREIKKLWELFLKVDATQLEINPLVETDKAEVISVDAKLNFDDNAKYRQKSIFSMENNEEEDPREVTAASYNLNYIGMNGNIGCLVNGAGLAMATMDIIKLYGGEPANFLDVGGGVSEKQVSAAFQILTADKNVQAILVNVFGGIVNCSTIANGIVNSCKSAGLKIPLVVRLQGTNVNEARKIIDTSGLPIQTASSLDDAALKAIKSIS
ncbi:hypothetical protein RN001_016132 [Aquatica leii]|uniref:Succinate--CoA ligase [GDP-forming] subunit beta, mitochondrial n=1 Tax=Aquatica leii TaxID=1421715 RepID=A0AAN7SKA2_9COLE|nr:hypothetical protein RN001_016132 [Aquatica leii]